jgi:hypothetical protein
MGNNRFQKILTIVRKDVHISPDLEFYKNKARDFEQKYYELRATFGTKIFELEQKYKYKCKFG